MDNILDACFDEELFNVPLWHSKRKKEKRIESRNPWKYAETLIPIYENHKVDKDEIMELDCRASHEIALDDRTIPEEDRLYNFFASLCGQDRKFMRTWLHLFVRLHKRYFTTLATSYFKRKGLTLENWLDSVQDSRKGDVLALLSLCMLVEKHVLVHLHNNQIWTSLQDSEDSHDVIMSKVDIHLVYLGRGNFALLQKRESTLQIVHRSPDVDSIVVGTFIPLSPDEDKTLNSLILSGLGFGLDRDTKATYKDISKSLMSASSPPKATVTDLEHEVKIPVKPVSELKLILHKLEVKPGELIHITDELLDSITSTPYSEATRRLMQTSNISNEMDYSSDTTIPYSDNTLTQNIVNRKCKSKRTRSPLKSRKRRIPHKFKLNTYGIRRHHMCKYTYKCKMVNCNRKFNNAWDWNSHHRL